MFTHYKHSACDALFYKSRLDDELLRLKQVDQIKIFVGTNI